MSGFSESSSSGAISLATANSGALGMSHLPPSVEHANGRQAPPARSRGTHASDITRGACQRTPQGAVGVRWGVPRDAAPRPGPSRSPGTETEGLQNLGGGVGGSPKLNSAANTPRRGRARGFVCLCCGFPVFAGITNGFCLFRALCYHTAREKIEHTKFQQPRIAK